MRSRSTTVAAPCEFALFLLAVPICLLAGCGIVSPFYPLPSPPEVTPEGVRVRVLPPVVLNVGDPALRAASLERPTALDSAENALEDAHVSAPPPLPETAPPPLVFSLPQAVAFGLQNNPRLVAALAAIDRARAGEEVAFAPFLPIVEFLTHGGVTSPTLGPASAGQTGIILPSAIETHSYAQAELQLQWTIFDFGRRAGRYRQAEARKRIAELQSTRAEETVGFDVATAYLDALRAAAVRLIQEEAIRRDEATLRDTRSRRAAGVAERDDVLRAEVQLAATSEDLDLARQAELTALARLNNAMGRNAGLPLNVIDWKSRPKFDLSLVQCLEIAASRRPEIGVAQQAVAVARAGRDVASAEFRPIVYTRGSVGTVAGSHIQTGPQEGIGVHIDMPLFTGGRLRGELQAADADVRQAVADARSILDGVTLEVTQAYVAATTARRRIDLDAPAITEARENLRLVRNRYRNGTATPTDIVDAETALTRAQQRLVSATYEYLGALAALDYALGNPPGQLLGSPDCAADPAGNVPETAPAPRLLPKVE